MIMRKKSHISLAGYILRNMESEDLRTHKKAFFIGSILPDCMPSFLTRKHNIDETFTVLKKEIDKVTDDHDIDKGINTHFCRRLGVITHYVADYFTFPHNHIFPGKLKDHCEYEEELKHTFRDYVQNSTNIRSINGSFKTVDEICDFIKRMHERYLEAVGTVKLDCSYIAELCFRVVDAILQIFELKTGRVASIKEIAQAA